MSADGPEARIAASEERAREDMDNLDLAELLADESRDDPSALLDDLTDAVMVAFGKDA